jgi:hypothetical protein
MPLLVPPTNLPKSDYDTEFFEHVVADSGRWAYGVVMVEVWVMNKHRTHLERPEGGLWIDPVVRDYGQENNTKFQRLMDPTLDDYFPPIPKAPGVGIPGVLWAEQQGARGNVALDSSSHRNGTTFGGRSRRGGHRRNRTLFPFETVRGGTHFFSTSEIKEGNTKKTSPGQLPRGQHVDEIAITGTLEPRHQVKDDSTSLNHKRQPFFHRERHRRSASMDDVVQAAARNAIRSSPTRDPNHRRLAHDEDLELGVDRRKHGVQLDKRGGGGGGGGVLHPQQRYNLLPKHVLWRRISELANDPHQPFNPRIHYLEFDCGLGYAAGVSLLRWYFSEICTNRNSPPTHVYVLPISRCRFTLVQRKELSFTWPERLSML